MLIQFIIALVVDILLMFAGYKLSLFIKNRNYRIIIGTVFFLLCLPAILFLIIPLGLFRLPLWFIHFRTIPGIEFLSVFWGLFIGFVTVKKSNSGKIRWKMFNKYFYIIGILLIVPQYIDFIALPVNYDSYKDTWRDGVCIQSEDYTCGPAALATVFRYLGQEKTETEIARAMQTHRSGTSIYEIIRYAKKNGGKVRYMYEEDLSKIPSPSVLEVTVQGGIGHVVAFLGSDGDRFIIGEPLQGRILLSKEEFFERYEYDGFVLNINNK
jgi:hypothetical protein